MRKSVMMPTEELTFRSELFRRMDRHDKDLEEIKRDVKDTSGKVGFQNGRVTKLEEWSNEAKKIIEDTNKLAADVSEKYTIDKTRIWSVIGVLIFLGGTIITLAIMAIDTKIKEGITSALKENVTKIEVER